MFQKIISGGQTGVDRAALDVALRLGLPIGGWCPRGRIAQDGPLPVRYTLVETPSDAYAQRTEWNVRDSSGTLVLAVGAPEGGTALTIAFAKKYTRPCLLLDLIRNPQVAPVRQWQTSFDIRVLNVAGPREETHPGIYQLASHFLTTLLSAQSLEV